MTYANASLPTVKLSKPGNRPAPMIAALLLALGVCAAYAALSARSHQTRPVWAAAAVAAAQNQPGVIVTSSTTTVMRKLPGMVEDLDVAMNRRVCPAYGPGDTPSISFLHIPKTAGMLMVQTLADLMPAQGPGKYCQKGTDPSADLPPVFSTCSKGQPEEPHKKYFAAVKDKFTTQCSGFAAHQDSAFFDMAGVDPEKTVTLIALRHPVDRVISDYYYSLKQGASWLDRYRPANTSDFSGLRAFVTENRDGLNNLGTQMVGGARHCEWAPGTPPNTPADRMLDVAKARLEKTCILLITEYLEESLLRLAAAMGWEEARVLGAAFKEEEESVAKGGQRVNATPKPKVPLEVRQVIAQHNDMDMQMYEHATRIFVKQLGQKPELSRVRRR